MQEHILNTSMQLRLSIVIKTIGGRAPIATVQWSDKCITIDQSTTVELDVLESDIVKLTMTGKGPNDTLVVDNHIVEDMAVILTGVYLGGVNFTNQLDNLLCYDLQGTQIPNNSYISRDGYIEIDIKQLLVSDFDYNEINYLSFEDMALEVLGRPSTLKNFN